MKSYSLPLDLVIVGTPRSGSSSLFRWLNEHPQLTGSRPKETFYFMDASHPLAGRRGASFHEDGVAGLHKFFPGTSRAEVCRLEATPHHFYQRTARLAFAQARQPPLILFLLREPGWRVLSSFRYTRENLGAIDRRLAFDTYVRWLLADEVARAKPFFRSISSYYIAAKELELGRYVEWIDRWRRDLGPQRLEIVLLDEMRRHPKEICERICRRLRIDPSFYQTYEFSIHNRSLNRVRSQRLQRLVRKVRMPVPESWRSSISRLYNAVQDRDGREPLPDDELRGLQRLQDYFAPWNAELGERYALDLGSWRSDADG